MKELVRMSCRGDFSEELEDSLDTFLEVDGHKNQDPVFDAPGVDRVAGKRRTAKRSVRVGRLGRLDKMGKTGEAWRPAGCCSPTAKGALVFSASTFKGGVPGPDAAHSSCAYGCSGGTCFYTG